MSTATRGSPRCGAEEAVAERAEAFLKRHTETYDVPTMEAGHIREILKDRHLKDVRRRKELVGRNVFERREAIMDALVSAMREKVDTADILAAFEDGRRRLKERFGELLGTCDRSARIYLLPALTEGMMNFHPDICSTMTVARLVGAEPGGKPFFKPVELDADSLAFDDEGVDCDGIFRDLAERSDFCRMLEDGMLKTLEKEMRKAPTTKGAGRRSAR